MTSRAPICTPMPLPCRTASSACACRRSPAGTPRAGRASSSRTTTWYTPDGKPFSPYIYYWVGGNTKFYGAALLRLRERDFGEVHHVGGISPAWPLAYRDFEPYYTRAEHLYQVHGQHGGDPLDPPTA